MNTQLKNVVGVCSRVYSLSKSNNFLQSLNVNQLQFCTSLSNSGDHVMLNRKRNNVDKIFTTNTEYFRQFHSPVLKKVKHGIEKTVDKLLLIDANKKKNEGWRWYRTLDQVDILEMLTLLNMPDTFFSWFKVTELHVWMILVRLMKELDVKRYSRTSMVELMWQDVEKKAKLVAPVNTKFKNDLVDLDNKFKVSIFIYDEGYLIDDMMMANALWYNFFQKKCDDPRFIEALISYVRFQLDFLHTVTNIEESLDKTLTKVWTPFKPHYDKIMS